MTDNRKKDFKDAFNEGGKIVYAWNENPPAVCASPGAMVSKFKVRLVLKKTTFLTGTKGLVDTRRRSRIQTQGGW